MVLCRCDCGVKKYIQRSHLLSGASKNCGCLKVERIEKIGGEVNKIHGMSGSAVYKRFYSAKARCNNPQNESYPHYGGRGIKMKWDTFNDFWRDMGDSYCEHVKKYGIKNTTLDRIDVNGNYCKENCRWATWDEQCNNMSTNRKVIYRGKEYSSISKLCKELGVKHTLVRDRLRCGWSIEDAINLPLCINNHEREKRNSL